ncbi:hypothetical protein ATANTOWER_018993, partial [Ataeniobius toweri]|nr:hypothetical protein [Ataeniobius toweri]
MNKGQCVTKYYRWIQKNGGYIWIQSSATIAINAKNSSEKNIIWVNYVLSNLEYKDTPIDIAQLPNLPEKASESSETSDSESESKENSETTVLLATWYLLGVLGVPEDMSLKTSFSAFYQPDRSTGVHQ